MIYIVSVWGGNFLHFTKQIVPCIPWSERLGRLPKVTQLGSIKAMTGIYEVWQESPYFQWMFYRGAENLYREGRQKKAGREDGGGSETFIWLALGSQLKLGAQMGPGYTLKVRALAGRYKSNLKERMEAGIPVGKHIHGWRPKTKKGRKHRQASIGWEMTQEELKRANEQFYVIL